MKRILCVITVGLLLLALLPMGAVARGKANDSQTISSVKLYDFVPPWYGSEPDYYVYADYDALYEVTNTVWYESVDGEDDPMQPEDFFDNEDAAYYMVITVQADEGACFDPENLTVDINDGMNCIDGYELNEDNTIVTIFTDRFDIYGMDLDPDPLETMAVTELEMPVIGLEPNRSVDVDIDADYSWYDVDWYWTVDGVTRKIGKYDVFSDIGTYHAEILMRVKIGYAYTPDTVVSVNGETGLVDSVEIGERDFVTIKTVEIAAQDPIFIDGIDVELDIPKYGAGLSIPESEYAEYLTIEFEWYRYGDDYAEFASDFNTEGNYFINMIFTLGRGYEFSEDVVITINGDPDLVDDVTLSENGRRLVVFSTNFVVEEETVVPGDATGNGSIDTEDALVVLRAALGIAGDQDELLACCDMDGNGVIDTTDALIILRIALGISA